MKTKFLPLIIALALTVDGVAAGWSLVERGYIKRIPLLYAQHTAGIISIPSDADVQAAVDFGITTKEKSEPLQYAYLIKSRESALNQDSIYVAVSTPLQLIAAHAREQAQQYRKPDVEYIDYCRKLGLANISVVQQFMTKDFRSVGFKWEIILLRDGVRVESVAQLRPWKNGNPFAVSVSFTGQQKAVIASIQDTAIQQMRIAAAAMGEDGKDRMLRQLLATGWSDEKICRAMNWTAEELARHKGTDGPVQAADATIPLGDHNGIFPIEELRKPGRYEIIFRRITVGLMGAVGDKEVHVPIDFSKFR